MADLADQRLTNRAQPTGHLDHGGLHPHSPKIQTLGDAVIRNGHILALFCSVRCPGKLILETYDAVQRLRDAGVTVISGFHSPMEKECLTILLRSPHQVIWCLARGMLKVIPTYLKGAVDSGRLALVTPFPERVRHVTARTAMARNHVVADMASVVLVPHAAPGSKMEGLCHAILSSGKPLYTFDHPANAALIQAGAKVTKSDMDWNKIIEASRSARGRSPA